MMNLQTFQIFHVISIISVNQLPEIECKYFSTTNHSFENENTFINESSNFGSSRSMFGFVNGMNISDVPEQKELTEKEIFNQTETISNMALNYWSKWKTYNKTHDWFSNNNTISTCDTELPSPYNLNFNNIHWQSYINNEDLNLYLFNAYYDNRESTNKVRIIGVTDHFEALKSKNQWCLLYFDNKRKPVLTTIAKYTLLWNDHSKKFMEKGVHLTVLISCDIPNEISNEIPEAVALIPEKTCIVKLNNYLRVIYEKPIIRRQFGVCVQALRFGTNDLSVKLIEWLELLRILGANRVFLYSLSVHENMEKVLRFYSQQGLVDWKNLTLPGYQINSPLLYQWYYNKIQGLFWPQEVLELNDCYYRNIHNYEYIAVIDIDEVIIAVKGYNWSQLIAEIKNSIGNKDYEESVASYMNYGGRVFNDIILENNEFEPYLFTMSHVYRQKLKYYNVKCFYSTRNVEFVHNHSAQKCLLKNGSSYCVNHLIDPKISYFLHYKKGINFPIDCKFEDKRKCAVFDPIIWKYYEELNQRMIFALKNIF